MGTSPAIQQPARAGARGRRISQNDRLERDQWVEAAAALAIALLRTRRSCSAGGHADVLERVDQLGCGTGGAAASGCAVRPSSAALLADVDQRRRPGLWFRHEQKGRVNPMQTSAGEQGEQCLARAWLLLDRGEHLARAGGDDQASAGLWLLAANAILRARDALEAIHPDAAGSRGLQVPGGTCSDLVRAAARQLASIPAGHEPAGLSLALVHLADADHEVEGRSCS